MKKNYKSVSLILPLFIALAACQPPVALVPTIPNPTPTSSISNNSTVGTVTEPTNPNPTPTVNIGGGGGGLQEPIPTVTPSSITTIGTSTPIPTPITNLPQITISSVSLSEANSGNVVTLRGTNFINGKAKNILFVNSANTEITATIVKITDNELTFSVPDNTRSGIPAGSNELSQAYQYVKVFITNENAQRITINDSFKIIFLSSGSTSGGGFSGGGGSLIVLPTPSPTVTATPTPIPTPTPNTGNVIVDFNPNPPTQVQFGTVTGVLRNGVDDTVVSGASVNVFDSNGNQVGQGLTQSDGTYSVATRVGTGYYITYTLNGFTTFNYYLDGLSVTNNTVTNIENIYLTASSIGSKVISGKLENVSGIALGNVVLKYYNVFGRLIMTGRTLSTGEYSFTVPFSNDGYFLIDYTGYRQFFYYIDINSTTVARFATICLTPTNDTEPTASISGQLFDAVTRQGISLGIIDVTTTTGKLIFSSRANDSGVYNFSFRSGSYGGCIVRRRGYGSTFVNNLEAFGAGISPAIYLVNEANFGIGGVIGTIVDSQNQSDVSGLTLRVRSGINNKTGTILSFRDRNGATVTSTVSGPRGSYTIDGLDAGNYTVEIVGKTILLNGTAVVYTTSYFNILVIGNDTTQSTGTVTRQAI